MFIPLAVGVWGNLLGGVQPGENAVSHGNQPRDARVPGTGEEIKTTCSMQRRNVKNAYSNSLKDVQLQPYMLINSSGTTFSFHNLHSVRRPNFQKFYNFLKAQKKTFQMVPSKFIFER